MKSLVKLAAVLSPSCKQAARLQSRRAGEKLSCAERIGLRVHLWLCGWCRRYGEQVNWLRSSADSCEPDPASPVAPELSAEARKRIEQRIRSRLGEGM